MSRISIQPTIDFRIVLEAASKLNLLELEVIANEFNALLAIKKAKSQEKRIEELYHLINTSVLSTSKQQRFDKLYQKLLNKTMTAIENEEFQLVTAEEAKLRNLRVAYMVELAQLRNIPFSKLLIELGLKPIPNV